MDVEYYEAASKRVLPQFTAAENLPRFCAAASWWHAHDVLCRHGRHRDGDADGVRENRRPDAPVVQFRSGDEQARFRRDEQPDDGRPVHASIATGGQDAHPVIRRVMVIDGSVAPLVGDLLDVSGNTQSENVRPRPEPS